MTSDTPAARRLRHLLVETALHVSATEVFHLASGRSSAAYVDMKMALALPEVRALLGTVLLDRYAPVLACALAVGGPTLGAYPLALAVSDAVYRADPTRSLRAFVVRQAPKGHGRRKLLEGLEVPVQGIPVLLVDDMLTTGASLLHAATTCRALGCTVVQALVVVEREGEGGRAHLASAGVPCAALYTLAELVAVAQAMAPESRTHQRQHCRTCLPHGLPPCPCPLPHLVLETPVCGVCTCTGGVVVPEPPHGGGGEAAPP
jgi:orotate phosphoribosyltransferase